MIVVRATDVSEYPTLSLRVLVATKSDQRSQYNLLADQDGLSPTPTLPKIRLNVAL